ncbi:MAG: type transport system permease protein [Acidimicrobiaceae bacterium]|jgi:ABC-2 type transport system permease protein
MSGPRLLWHQLGLEQRAFWRNPETAFFTFALPVGLLVIFGFTSANDKIPGRPELKALTLFVPGILAFGIIVAAYGSLAATIAMLRADGVLKRIRATPLAPGMYLAGQLTSVLVTSVVVGVTTIVLGRLAFGIAPRSGGVPALLGCLALGVVCFAALGVAVSALIPRADAAGAITNGTYLPLALVSGTFSSGLTLPTWMDHIVSAFPIKALVDGLRAGYDPASHGPSVGSVLVLVAWTMIGIVLARRYFRWEPNR